MASSLSSAGQSLTKVAQLSNFTSGAKQSVAAIIADGNNLFTLYGVHLYPALIQVSVNCIQA